MCKCFYEVPVRVKPAEGCNMPPEWKGAIVNCYVSAETHLAALEMAVKQLLKDKYIFVNIDSDIREIDPGKWDDFLQAAWSEFLKYFPSQEEVLYLVEKGGFFYGPFVGYTTEEE